MTHCRHRRRRHRSIAFPIANAINSVLFPTGRARLVFGKSNFKYTRIGRTYEIVGCRCYRRNSNSHSSRKKWNNNAKVNAVRSAYEYEMYRAEWCQRRRQRMPCVECRRGAYAEHQQPTCYTFPLQVATARWPPTFVWTNFTLHFSPKYSLYVAACREASRQSAFGVVQKCFNAKL